MKQFLAKINQISPIIDIVGIINYKFVYLLEAEDMMSQYRALIIEDQEELADIYSNALEMSNIETQIITDGKVALESLPDLHPDLIILDMNLPRVSGHYLYKQVRSLPHLAHVPVVICTANSVMASAMEGEIGEQDFILIKPVSIYQLNGLVERILK